MGKREDQRKLKLCMLARIKANKHILFGAFSGTITKQTKTEIWKTLHEYAKSLGLLPPTKDYKYLRDVWWPNVKKTTTEKVDNSRKTGTGGGPEKRMNEMDEEILDILGKDSPIVHGLGVVESGQSNESQEDNVLLLPENTARTIQNTAGTSAYQQNLQEPNVQIESAEWENQTTHAENINITPPSETSRKGIKRKSAPIIKPTNGATATKQQLQIELIRNQIYKTQLEARQLEISLGFPVSIYTTHVLPNNMRNMELQLHDTSETVILNLDLNN